MADRTYIAIDLKSFYASVECVERHLDPLTTNLVVADVSRSEKTICLAVSPPLKAQGIKGRPRLFEVVQRVKAINAERRMALGRRTFTGKSVSSVELASHPEYELAYIAAPPQMALYIKYSTMIYSVYLKYVASDDIHVYSIDEVFIDATSYLKLYKISAHELAVKMIRDVLALTGITATAGIGTNLYLAKIAMDIVAKHEKPDKDGVRIAFLDEMTYRKTLWNHEPLTDFWRIGAGYAERLNRLGLHTMGDIARCSVQGRSSFFNEDSLYKAFGINAELLIDHAWGFENCTIKDIKEYRPNDSSISTGQVLPCAYSFDKARIVIREMAESLALDLFSKKLFTKQITLYICYDKENVTSGSDIVQDFYGRLLPKPVHSFFNFDTYTSSSRLIAAAADTIFCRIVNRNFTIKKLSLGANSILTEHEYRAIEQPDLFSLKELHSQNGASSRSDFEYAAAQKEKDICSAVLNIHEKFGKNALLKGMNLQEGATQKLRNTQIGGHHA